MPTGYWLKLYTDILYDPKMGRLTNILWRRAIECFLLAKEKNENGLLPSLADMAFILRSDSPEALESDLLELQRVGILNNAGQGWRVVNFEKRQAPISDAERKRMSRARATTSAGHELVTGLSRTGHENVLEEEVEVEEEGEGEVEEEGRGKTSPSSYLLAMAIAEVARLDLRVARNKKRVDELTSELNSAGYTVSDVRKVFGENGWWYRHHWLGKKGEPPTLSAIAENIAESRRRDRYAAFVVTGSDEEDDAEPMPSPGGETPTGGQDCIGSASP